MSAKRPLIRRVRATPAIADEAPPSKPADLLDLPLGDAAPESELGFKVEADDEVPGERPGAPEEPGLAMAQSGSTSIPGGSSIESSRHRRPRGPSSSQRDQRAASPRRRRPARWPWLLLFLLLLPVAAIAGFLLRPMPPVATFSTDLIDFSAIRLGEESERRLTLRNDGEAPLELLEVTILDDPDGVIRRGQGNCTEAPLAATESCELSFIMAPVMTQSTRARLSLLTNASEVTRTVPMIGSGIAPELAVEPAKLELGRATVGERGKRGEVRLANKGSASLRVDSVRLEGLGAADFVRTRDRCRQTELAPGASCTVGFEFVPTKDGVRRATLHVSAGAVNSRGTELEGIGIPQLPELALGPDRLDFGSLRVGERSAAKPVELRNDGNGPLDIRAVTIGAGTSGDEPSFSLEDSGCAGRRLEPGASCRLETLFSPRREGAISAMVEIRHSAAPGIHRVPLVGSGTAPRAVLSTRQLGFGEVPVGTDSGWQKLEVRNTGSAELRVEKISVHGADARSFQVSAEGCLRAPIPPSQSCTAEVRFRARRDGPHRAEVRVAHDAASAADQLAINGLGTSARLGVDPVQIDFGTVRVGQQRSRQLILRNTGRAPLKIRRLRLSGGEGLGIEEGCAETEVPAGGTCVVTLTLTSSRAASVRSRLQIEHESAGSPREIPIQGTVEPKPKPELQVEPQRLDFRERYIGERSPILTVILRNVGDAPLSLRESEIDGGDAADFQLVPGSCTDVVPARGSCSVGVAFLPVAPGGRQAALAIRHNAARGIVRIPLIGTGVVTGGGS